MRVRHIAAIAALAAASSACSGGGAPAPVLTPAASTVVPGGPVLVYSSETPLAERRGGVDLTVAAFDTGTWRELRRTVLPAAQVSGLTLTQRGALLYAWRPAAGPGYELRALDPVRGSTRTLYAASAGSTAWSIAVSPDGGFIAFTDVPDRATSSPASVRVLEATTGAVRTVATFADPRDSRFAGVPVPRVWRDDGRGFVVSGDTGSDAGGFATVMLDGAIVYHRARDAMYLSPSGRVAATGGYADVACARAGQPQRLQLWDLQANNVLASVDDAAGGIRQRAWSPAGDELLYSLLSPDEALRACPRTGPEPSGALYVLSTHGGPPQPVADVAALRRRWYGSRTTDVRCDDGTLRDPYGACSIDRGTLLLDGRPVSSGEGIRVLGFFD